MKFLEKLEAAAKKNDSLVCVGLDSNLDNKKFPQHLIHRHNHYPIFEFNKAIIDATHDLVQAYKPNSAFYEGMGAIGLVQLRETCEYIHTTYPEIPIILDAKRGDIGSTNMGYVRYAFQYLGADAITLHPYLGREALQPFLDEKEKGCIILCRTSNPGAGEFQNDIVNGEPQYKRVARQVVTEWNINDNCLLVVGATYPKELEEIRGIAPNMTLLIPGIGAQGGDLPATVKNGHGASGPRMIINNAREIIFASSGTDFDQAARAKTQEMRTSINELLSALK